MHNIYKGVGYMSDDKIDMIKICESIWGIRPPRRDMIIPEEKKDDTSASDCTMCDHDCCNNERNMGDSR